jgi:hypothetical protein
MSGWIVKYDGPCSMCGTTLRAGTTAAWDRRLRKMHCIVCPTGAPAEPSPPPLERGTAGASARREHERRLAKDEARRKEVWGDRVGGWINRLADERPSTRAWAVGATGEEELEAVLESVAGVEVLHDRRIPGRAANIDHIVIAPAGVFVVDTKRYTGRIEIKRKGSFFRPEDRLYVGRFDRTKDVEGVRAQAGIVEQALIDSQVAPNPTVTPVLCFIDGDWPLPFPPNQLDGVYLEGPKSIKKLVLSASDYSPDEIERLARALAGLFPPKDRRAPPAPGA